MATMNTQEGVKPLNKLVRGEISAIETYEQAMSKIKDAPDAARLRQICDDHKRALESLKLEVSKYGGKPDESSGAWGAFAKTVEGSAAILGDQAALKALKEGEEHGIKNYEEALNDKNVDAEFKQMISSELLPRSRDHIQTLDSLMKTH